jgi:hypothetical protein
MTPSMAMQCPSIPAQPPDRPSNRSNDSWRESTTPLWRILRQKWVCFVIRPPPRRRLQARPTPRPRRHRAGAPSRPGLCSPARLCLDSDSNERNRSHRLGSKDPGRPPRPRIPRGEARARQGGLGMAGAVMGDRGMLESQRPYQGGFRAGHHADARADSAARRASGNAGSGRRRRPEPLPLKSQCVCLA